MLRFKSSRITAPRSEIPGELRLEPGKDRVLGGEGVQQRCEVIEFALQSCHFARGTDFCSLEITCNSGRTLGSTLWLATLCINLYSALYGLEISLWPVHFYDILPLLWKVCVLTITFLIIHDLCHWEMHTESQHAYRSGIYKTTAHWMKPSNSHGGHPLETTECLCIPQCSHFVLL